MKKFKIDEFVKDMNAQFYGMDVQIDILTETFRTSGNNALFYGRGGYAKTALMSAAAKYVTDEVFHLQANAATDETAILGVVSIKKLMQDDVYSYNTEGTLTLSEVAVLDEMLDMPGPVMAAFKTVLFDKKVCTNNGVCVLSKLQHALGGTNVNPDDWVVAAGPEQIQSRDALLKRFHFINECVWERHTEHDYREFLKKRKLSFEPRFIKLIMEMNDVIDVPFSPRDCELMLQIWNNAKAAKANPLKAVLYFQKMNASCRSIINEYIERGITDDAIAIRLVTITEHLDNLKLQDRSVEEVAAEYNALKKVRDTYLEGAVTFEYVKDVANAKKRIDVTMNNMLEILGKNTQQSESTKALFAALSAL